METKFCRDTLEAAQSNSDDLMFAADIMATPEFKAFLQAENKLVAVMFEMAGNHEWGLHHAVSCLGKAVNKSLTFKAIPWDNGKKLK
jgi:hypothetical protein